MASSDDLVRIVQAGDGELAVGRSLPGRGAWLCRNSSQCLETARRRRAFARALRSEVSPEAVTRLRSTLVVRARMEKD